ncbi:MAG: 30S ribosome-binding factor RbfA [Nitrospirales bacterium]|nr:30S ribosome-binding factor RbfA [Nitrospirales bacterium]
MHPYKRSQRLNILLREEIASIIMSRVKDPRLGFVTVTEVELSDDLKIARVYISVLDPKERELNLEVLSHAKGIIRNELSKKVRMKVVPTLEFFIDKSIDSGDRIDNILKQIREGHDTAGGDHTVPEDEE